MFPKHFYKCIQLNEDCILSLMKKKIYLDETKLDELF